MNVHLDHFKIADANNAVADPHKIFAKFIDIGKRRALFEIDNKNFFHSYNLF